MGAQCPAIARAAPLAPVHGRKLWIEVCHGHVVTLLHRGDGEMQGRAWFSRRPPFALQTAIVLIAPSWFSVCTS